MFAFKSIDVGWFDITCAKTDQVFMQPLPLRLRGVDVGAMHR